MREIRISNTLSGQKEVLETVEPGHVRLYACGVTVYDHCHIGHAMQAIFFDMIRRYLEYSGFKVTYVRNFTDVDDKIIARAAEQGIPPLDLVDTMIASSQRDMQALGILNAHHEPRVSGTIPEIIKMIEDLIANGAAYDNGQGDVYYRVRSKADYGKLSNRRPDEMRSGTRDLASGGKEDELDFALWKKDDVAGASWTSPWGTGRPGWHIECSAMAKKYLGTEFDIHGGGRDLVFPHHENEIAQSESANGCDYARYWIHSGLMTINKQKMSKSLGNQITISDFLERWPAEVLRLAFLQQHYTSDVDFSEQVFRDCARRLLYSYETLRILDEIAGANPPDAPLPEGFDPQKVREEFHANMSNDFNTPCALRDLNLTMRRCRDLQSMKKSAGKKAAAAAMAKVLRELFAVQGLLQEDPAAFIEGLKLKILPELGLDTATIDASLEERSAARREKDWQRSDQIRDDLLGKGIEIMDTPGGTRWTIRLGPGE